MPLPHTKGSCSHKHSRPHFRHKLHWLKPFVLPPSITIFLTALNGSTEPPTASSHKNYTKILRLLRILEITSTAEWHTKSDALCRLHKPHWILKHISHERPFLTPHYGKIGDLPRDTSGPSPTQMTGAACYRKTKWFTQSQEACLLNTNTRSATYLQSDVSGSHSGITKDSGFPARSTVKPGSCR